MSKKDRDVLREVSKETFIASLRRLADALEADEKFEIQVQGERVYIPARAECSIEHERDGDSEEIEFQLRWSNS